MASRARRVALASSGLVIAIAVIGLFIASRGGGDEEKTAPAAKPEARAAAAPAARRPGQLVRPAILRPAQPAEAPPGPDGREHPPITSGHAGRAREILQEAARPCFDQARQRDPDVLPVLSFRYTLVVESRRGHATGVSIDERAGYDPDLVACVKARLAEARFDIDLPDMQVAIGDGFSFAEAAGTPAPPSPPGR